MSAMRAGCRVAYHGMWHDWAEITVAGFAILDSFLRLLHPTPATDSARSGYDGFRPVGSPQRRDASHGVCEMGP